MTLCITYDWYFAIQINSPCLTISNNIWWCFLWGSVNPLHKSPQCQPALRTARATAIKILKTNLDGPSPRGATSFRADLQVSGRQLKSRLLNRYRIFRVSVSVTVQSKVTRSRLRVVRRRTHADGQENVPSSGQVVSGRKGPFPHIWLLAEKSCVLQKNEVLFQKNPDLLPMLVSPDLPAIMWVLFPNCVLSKQRDHQRYSSADFCNSRLSVFSPLFWHQLY